MKLVKRILLWLFKLTKQEIKLSYFNHEVKIPNSIIRSFNDYRNIKRFFVHEKEVCSTLVNLVESCDHFIDIGANLGLYCVLARKLNPICKISAIEPIKGNIMRMKKILDLNQTDNVVIYNNFVGNTQTRHLVPVDTNSTTFALTESRQNFTEEYVYEKCLTDLIDILADINDHIVILIDVDGYEKNVLDGLKNLMTYNCTFIVEIHPIELSKFNSDISDVFYHFYKYNYKGKLLRYPENRKKDHKQIHVLFQNETNSHNTDYFQKQGTLKTSHQEHRQSNTKTQ